jgi:hypothetical protein
MKTRPVEAELFQADRQTNMKLMVAFRNFVQERKNEHSKILNRGCKEEIQIEEKIGRNWI